MGNSEAVRILCVWVHHRKEFGSDSEPLSWGSVSNSARVLRKSEPHTGVQPVYQTGWAGITLAQP